MGRFQLELINLYFPPLTVENKGKLILTCPNNNKHDKKELRYLIF